VVVVALAGFWLFIARTVRDNVWNDRVVWSGTCSMRSLDPVKNGYELKFSCGDREIVWNDFNLIAKFHKRDVVPPLFCTVAKSGLLTCKNK